MRRLLAAAVCALALAAPAAAQGPMAPLYDGSGRLVETPFVPTARASRLTKPRAIAIFEANGKVAGWLRHYPLRTWVADASLDGKRRSWTVKVWSGAAGEVATGAVDDASGVVTEAWTGPQVAWKMARGYDGAFGGKRINSAPVWLAF